MLANEHKHQMSQNDLERQHAAVGEWLTQMRLASDFLLGQRDPELVRRLARHYRCWVRPHFRYEEERLFPAIRQLVGGATIAARLAAFEAEHRVLEARVEALLEELDALASGELNELQEDDTARRCRLIIDRVLLHAAQEDDLLQPLMEQHRAALTRLLGEAPGH
jgi:hemerythrin-like domain-containing protein